VGISGEYDAQGEEYAQQDSEFPAFLENELLDILEQDIKLYTGDPAYQASLRKGLSQE
jgi:hypothetical protein